jgi:hypothetical protein
MGKKIHAKDCPCCKCGAPAVAFWPCIDPDIPAHPYCRECLDKANDSLLMKLCKDFSRIENGD